MLKSWTVPIYLILTLFLSGCESLFFWPSKTLIPSPEMLNFTKQDRLFTAEDGTIIHAWQLPTKEEKKGTIYFLHGNAQNLSYHIANVYWLVEKGWEVVIIDYRGYGQSVGKPDFMSVQKDALAGYQTLLNERSDNRPIIVWGQSLGASIAINMVASLPFSERPQGLIIDSSFSSYQKIMQETLGKSWLTWLFQYPLSRLITPAYDPVQAISKIEQVPLLIVHSENDLLISSNHAEILFEKANDPKELWLSQQKGHIKIWNNKIWRDKLSCQLTNWPVLQQFQQACLFEQKDLLESPAKEAYSKRIN